jgi:hypothetical protein
LASASIDARHEPLHSIAEIDHAVSETALVREIERETEALLM